MLTETSEPQSSSAASSSAGDLLRSFGEELQLATSYLTATQAARRAWTRAEAAGVGSGPGEWAIAAEGQEAPRPARADPNSALEERASGGGGGGGRDGPEAGQTGARRRVSAWLLGSERAAAAQPNHGSVSFTPAKSQPEAAQQQPPPAKARFEYCAQRAQHASQAAHAKLHRVELIGEGAPLRLLQPRAFRGRQPRPRAQQPASLPGPQPKAAADAAQQQPCSSCGGRCLHTCHHHQQQWTQQRSHTVTFALPRQQRQQQQQQQAPQQPQQQQQPYKTWQQQEVQTSYRHHHRSHRSHRHRTHQASAGQEQQRAEAAAQHVSHPGPGRAGLGGGASGGGVRFADPLGVVAQLQAMRSKMRCMQTEIVTFLQASTASDAELEGLGVRSPPLHHHGGGARPGSAGSGRSEALTRLKGLR